MLLRYGFEAAVLEGGLESVPEKCLAGTEVQTSQEEDSDATEVTPQNEVSGSKPERSLDDENLPQTELNNLRLENQRLQQQLAQIKQEKQALIDQLETYAAEDSHEDGGEGQLERQVLEEEITTLRRRVAELENHINQYQQDSSEAQSADEIVQALLAELQMVRDQADVDITRLNRQIERLKQKYQQVDREDEVAGQTSLLDQLEAVDPDQLPLQPPPTFTAPVDPKQGMINALLWFLVGWLASLAVLGIAIQTDTGKKWLTDWIEPGSQAFPAGVVGPEKTEIGSTPQPDKAAGSISDAFESEDEEELFAQ